MHFRTWTNWLIQPRRSRIRPNPGFLFCLFGAALLTVAAPHRCSLGDEIVLDHTNPQVSFGDFSCSTVTVDSSERLGLSFLNGDNGNQPGHTCEIKTGELYRYFKAQGITSLDSLVLYVDVDDLNENQQLSLESMQVSILGETRAGQPSKSLLEFSSADGTGENRMLIPGQLANDLRPAARLEVPLGFDFMSRFTESSSERLLVNLVYDEGSGANPRLSIEGRRHLFSAPNAVLLGSFVLFWSVVFWVLRRLTLHKPRLPEAGFAQSRDSKALAAPATAKKNVMPAA